MKRWNLFLIVVLIVAMSATIVAPAGACTEGCTPGYWKQGQHFDSWVGYSPGDYFDDVCSGMLPHITLLQALKARRKDGPYTGPEAAFLRHAAAALLNEAAGLDSMSGSLCGPGGWVDLAYGAGGFEHVKNILAGWNELGCPLN